MRYVVSSLLALVVGGYLSAAHSQQAPDVPASAAPVQTAEPTPIAPQNMPVQGKPEDPRIKVTGEKGTTVRSYLVQDAPLRSDYVLGSKKAPVVMVEYASLSCPHCAHFSNTVLPELEKKYINTGKLAYVLRQFPLNEPAMKGAMLVECVGRSSESQYYVFSRVLFDAQARWAFDSNFMAGLESISGVGGLSKQQFQACMNDKDLEMKVLEAKKKANEELKIPHTPYFVIDGELYEGDKSVEAISRFIDAKLAKKNK